jgi:hypothetical protein
VGKVSENMFCPICGDAGIKLIDLPNYPITEVYQKFEENSFQFPTSYDQAFNYCQSCQHGFLASLLDKDFIYDNYNTHSTSSFGSVNAINNFYEFINGNFIVAEEVIIDIGANDTFLLKKFKHTKAKLIGVDPNISSDSDQIECVKGYIEDVDIEEFGDAKKIYLCSHTLEHIFDPDLFLKQLNRAGTVDDEFFFQFPSLDLLVRDCRFDQVHHQHIQYFSLASIRKLLNKNGFNLIKHSFDSDHYGTLMIYFKKSPSIAYDINLPAITSSDIKTSYDAFFNLIRSADSRINFIKGEFYCFGASLMLPILAYYMPNLLKTAAILDADENKLGLSYVNFDRKIISDKEFNYSKSDLVITAVSTKLATRNILKILIDRKAENIILPLNTL